MDQTKLHRIKAGIGALQAGMPGLPHPSQALLLPVIYWLWSSGTLINQWPIWVCISGQVVPWSINGLSRYVFWVKWYPDQSMAYLGMYFGSSGTLINQWPIWVYISGQVVPWSINGLSGYVFRSISTVLMETPAQWVVCNVNQCIPS